MIKAIYLYKDWDNEDTTREVLILGFINYNGNTKAICQYKSKLIEVGISDLRIID